MDQSTITATLPGTPPVAAAFASPFPGGSPKDMARFIERLLVANGNSPRDNLWAARAMGLVDALVPALCFLRVNSGLVLSLEVIEEHLDLRSIEALCWEAPSKYPGFTYTVAPLANYLLNLHGYDRVRYAQGQEQGAAKTFHGFVVMGLTAAFAVYRSRVQAGAA